MKYKKEKAILASSWLATILLLILFTPKNKLREAQVSFLSKQVITWLFGFIVVESGLISYPVRFFKKAGKTSFTFEYFVYPALCSLFNIHYPEKRNGFIKLLYYIFHTSIITVFEYYAVRKTKLIQYHRWWTWKWSFATMFFTYYLSRLYYKWFFKQKMIHDV